jgi:tripartite ATP-independent transporter DctP family solute receptor
MNMKWAKTTLMTTLSLVLLLAGCSTGPAKTTGVPEKSPGTSGTETQASTKAVTITIGHVLKVTDAYQVAAETFKQVVETKSSGQIKVEIIPEGKLGAEKDMMTKTQSGELDASIITHGSVTSFVPEFGFLDTPFMIKDYDHAHQLLDGQIGTALGDGLKKAGFTPLGILDFGFRHLTNSKRAVQTPADAKGLLMRVLPNAQYQAMWEALTGKAPIVLNWTEVPQALKDGKIDGQENPISLLTSYKLWETQKYATRTGHVFAAAVFVINPNKFSSLTPEQQAVVQEAGREAVKRSRQFAADAEAKGWEMLKANGMVVVEQIDKEAFRQAVWEKVVPRFKSQFPAEWLEIALKG